MIVRGLTRSRRTRPPLRRISALALLVALLLAAVAIAGPPITELLARAQELLDAGDAEGALEILNPLVKKKPPDARVFLLRSTALFIEGDVDQGRRALDRALELDPGLRQAWLNKAALDLSEQRHAEALESLEKAQQLDPTAPDNDLNIGAVRLLQGQLQSASDHFRSYLQRNATSSQAYYWVATNYAMAGYAGPAIEHLRQAIDLDEKTRLKARTDSNFSDLESNPRFQQLLNTDSYQMPPGAYQRRLEVTTTYTGSGAGLLPAVLDALQYSNQLFDRRVEVTPDWALIWGEMRIKLTNSPDGKGQIHLSAPADRMTPAQWQQKSDALIKEITIRLYSRVK